MYYSFRIGEEHNVHFLYCSCEPLVDDKDTVMAISS